MVKLTGNFLAIITSIMKRRSEGRKGEKSRREREWEVVTGLEGEGGLMP